MIKNNLKTLKAAGLVLVALMTGLFIYHELWYLEYHIPPISFIDVSSQRAKLINEIESYQDIDEFKGVLKRNALQWEVSKENPTLPNSRPPFNIVTITIKNYYHLGFIGDLSVVFFNNRLMRTTFYAEQFEAYIEALVKKEGIKLDGNKEANPSMHTHMRLTKDYTNRKYIDWSDIRLDKEFILWLKRYS